MEYEEEENNVPGNIPEFGAIFMSNAETKRECFKWRVFALPSSKAGFVKQVKAGMVLFLFEFEKRQLFGVYKATSDGALNILPNVFRSGGKQFPAQVCFTPIWLCSPLSENEFQSAIHENYYSARKFKFGLSEDQVRRLLQLFSARKLNKRLPAPPRQLTRGVNWFSSKGIRQSDCGSFAIKEGLEMEQSNKDFTPTVMNDCFENLEDRGTEADNVRFYAEGRIEDEENLDSFGQEFLTDHGGDSLFKKRRTSYEGLETDKARSSSLVFGAGNWEIPMDKERISTASGKLLRGENIDNGCNIFNNLSPAIATKYSEGAFDLTKAPDYERPYSDGTNRLATVDDRFLVNNIMKTELALHNARRPVITNKHDSCLFERAGKTAEDCDFLRNSKLGHKHHIDHGIGPVVPSGSFETSLHRVRGTAGHRKFLMNERGLGERDPKRGFDERFDRRRFEERRFPRDNLVKANYVEGLDDAAALNMSSGYDTRIERQIANDFGFTKTSSIDNEHRIGTLPRPVMSTKSSAFHEPHQSLVECFNKPFPDIQFPGTTTKSQNFKASNSIFHDAVVTRSVPCVSEVPGMHHERPLSFGPRQSASIAQESIHHFTGGNVGLSKGKSFETEGSNRCNTSEFVNKVHFPNYPDYSGCPTDEICDGMDLKFASSADYRTFQFSPSTLGSVPFTKSDDFSARNDPLAFDGNSYVVSQDMQKYIPSRINDMGKHIPRQTNDEIYDSNELLSPYANLTEFDMCFPEKDPVNCHMEASRGYRTDVINDDSQYYRSPEGLCSDPEKHRRSVFARLTSARKLYAQEEQEEDADFYDASSIDEVMEMLHQNQNVQTKNFKKFNSLGRQHNEVEEMERNNKKIFFENHIEHGQSKIICEKINEAANPAIEQCVDDKPKETRMVEFKRRREKKKSLDDKSLESVVIRKEDSVSGEDKETKGPLDKWGKRRKLVRPVFGHNNLVNGTDSN